MTFIQSNITFGTYTFPAAFSVDTVQQPNQIDETKIPFLDGTSAPAGSRSSKLIRITGDIGGWGTTDSAGTYILTQDQAQAEFDRMNAQIEAGYQQLSIGDNPARYIYAQKKQSTLTPRPGSGRRAWTVQIDFVAQDPRWLALTPQSFGPSSSLHHFTVTSTGNAVTYPIVTFTGAYANPYLQIYPGTGNSTRYIGVNFAITMVGGDVLVIDSNPRNRARAVLFNGVPRLDLLGTTGITNLMGDAAFFPYILPGDNIVFAESVTANGSGVTLAFQDAWL